MEVHNYLLTVCIMESLSTLNSTFPNTESWFSLTKLVLFQYSYSYFCTQEMRTHAWWFAHPWPPHPLSHGICSLDLPISIESDDLYQKTSSPLEYEPQSSLGCSSATVCQSLKPGLNWFSTLYWHNLFQIQIPLCHMSTGNSSTVSRPLKIKTSLNLPHFISHSAHFRSLHCSHNFFFMSGCSPFLKKI